MTWFGLGVFVAAALGVTLRYRNSQGLTRRRLQLIGSATAIGTAASVVVLASRVLVGAPSAVGVSIASTALLIPLAFLAATNRKIVGRADQLLFIALRASGLAVFIAAMLLLFVAGLGGTPLPNQRGPLVLALIALAIAAGLSPLIWRRLSNLAHSVTYGDRPAPSDIPRDLAARLTRAAPAEEILLQFAEVLQVGLRLRAIDVYTVDDEDLALAVALPRRSARSVEADAASLEALAQLGVTGRHWLEVWLPALAGDAESNLRVVPATYAGTVLGVVIAERDRAGDPFTPTDDDVLTDTARRLGALLHSQRLDDELQLTLRDLRRHADQLQASRSRIVAAADEERQRLERDLHDGAQQRLVSLSVHLNVAREVLKENVTEAEKLLIELSHQAREAISELRTLAHGIYPPVLQSSGLAGALPDAAARMTIATDVRLEHVDRYPREIESTVYFCCLEALQNAAKHAGQGSNALLRVVDEEVTIIFEVSDDGVGFEPSRISEGRGFTNMSDRLGALGGRLDVESRPGEGTIIRGSIPLEPRASSTPSSEG